MMGASKTVPVSIIVPYISAVCHLALHVNYTTTHGVEGGVAVS